MIDTAKIDEITGRIVDAMPSGLKSFKADMEKNVRLALQSAFAKMDLVTREEFDVQAGVLLRTREKLEALEAKVAHLEAMQTGKK